MPKNYTLRKLSFSILLAVVNFDLIKAQTNKSSRCPHNFELKNGLCYPIERCPIGYFLNTDNLCYPLEEKPCPFEKPNTATAITTTNENRCPPEYFLHTDNLCYPIEQKPCPLETTSTSTTTANPTTDLPPPIPPPAEIRKPDCPKGSLMIDNKCRKIICSLGEYYRGTCLQPVCPQGLVWRGKKCQEPGFITTVLEIDNVFLNQWHEKPFAVITNNMNKVEYDTTTTTTTTSKPFTTVTPTTTTSSSTKDIVLNATDLSGCCKVITPRICKKYGDKWLCFNRKYQRCDSRVCTAPVVYLKAPEIKYEPPVLIMPPNPQIDDCDGNDCQNSTGVVDCSGCASNRPQNCSPHCYRYHCPNATCTFMNLNEYCGYYPGQQGCLPTDGCLWNWC